MDLITQMSQISPGRILTAPLDYMASDFAATYFTWYVMCFSLLVLPWAFFRLVKKGDSVPLFMWLGGVLCSFQESMLDNIGHLWYPPNMPGPLYIGYGVPVPLVNVFGYSFFVGMIGYWAYTRMQRPLTVKRVFSMWLLIGLSDIILEVPGTVSKTYIYYDQPLKIFEFPLAWAWINGTAWLMVGFFLWVVEPYLRTGWRRALVILMPSAGMGAGYGIVAWPYFNSLNMPIPVYATWLWTAFSLILSIIMVYAMAVAIEHISAVRAATARMSDDRLPHAN